MKKLLITVIIFGAFFLSCDNKKTTDINLNESPISLLQIAKNDILTEVEIDTTFIHHEIEYKYITRQVKCFLFDEDWKNDIVAINIQLLFKEKNEWFVKDDFFNVVEIMSSFDPIFDDYNFDGLIDLSFRSHTAARGSNEVRTIYLLKKKEQRMNKVKNSTDYPNIEVSNKNKWLNSCAIYGGCSTDFLIIESDTLKQIASVQIFGKERIVYEYFENGDRKLLLQDSLREYTPCIRYENYKPLIEYKY